MGLLEDWRKKAYDETADRNQLTAMWNDYFKKETEIYKQLLSEPDTEVKGTVKELADQYGISLEYMVGFLDGIQESLIIPNPIEDTLAEDTEVSLAFNKEKLYKNMVAADAPWLYQLPEWDKIYTKDEQHQLYLEQKKSGTIVKAKKIYPNDPCPCGSGKKYKKCHGRRA